VLAEAPGHHVALSSGLTAAGAAERFVELVLEPAHRLEGRVVNASDGRGIPGAWVRVGPGRYEVRAVADTDGRFVLDGIETRWATWRAGGGAYRVSAEAPRHAPGEVEVPLESRAEIIVPLRPEGE
jgi:hypothetical protein